MNEEQLKKLINKQYREIAVKSRTIAGYVNGKHIDINLLNAIYKDLKEIELVMDNYNDTLKGLVSIGWEHIDKMDFETL